MAKKKPRKPEPQTPTLALNPSSAKSSTASRRPPSEPLGAVEAAAPEVKTPEADGLALPNAATLARAIYRLALEQKDCVTLLRLAQALHPEAFGGLPAADRRGGSATATGSALGSVQGG